jgi:hypothetical protein
MSASDLESWLKEESSESAGWSKDDGSGETIGHERCVLQSSIPPSPHLPFPKSRPSRPGRIDCRDVGGKNSGRKIIEILKKNPDKDPEKYDQDDVDHMRKVVAYCKRHLAQEGKAKQDPNSKSARSLKNWGHDPQKA